MAWDYFTEGKRIGGYRVIERTQSANDQKATRYRVTCLVCGETSGITHQTLAGRILTDKQGCPSCVRAEAVALAAAVRKAKAEARVGVPDGVTDLAGRFWPRLGPMGPRHGPLRSEAIMGNRASEAPI